LGGYSPPEVPGPGLLIEIDYSITSNSRIYCIVDKLSLSNFASSIAEFTKTGSVQRNSILKLELMNIHKTQFPEDFQRFNEYVKDVGYPKGLVEDFYMNLFWEGLESSLAYKQMAAITVQNPLLSPIDKVRRDLQSSDVLSRPCGS
jgi:hypothetical protein